MLQGKLPCLVVFDISSNRIRTKVGKLCFDFGLMRFQMSCFYGEISSADRVILFKKMEDLLGDEEGYVLIQPLGREDVARRLYHGPPPPESHNGRTRKGDPVAPLETLLRFE